jgi:hypothetical protein
MKFFPKPFYKECPFRRMKNDIDNRRITGTEHPVAKPDTDHKEQNIPGLGFVGAHAD